MRASKKFLLRQDNTIPGNRKDGFRYHHLLFLIVATPFYLWLELAFGVRLLDAMGSHVRIEETEVIGHYGRLISGAAVALFLLSGWFRQCEKKDLPRARAIGIGVLVVLLSFIATWHIHEMVLEFYVRRSNAELPWAFAALALQLALGYGLYLLWLNKVSGRGRIRYLYLSFGVALLLGFGFLQGQLLRSVDTGRLERLGIERQQTATLTIYRRGLQEGLVSLPDGAHPPWALNSPEGKAYLALFPIFGSVYDQGQFAAERPRLIAEISYRDWDAEFGAQTYAGYRQVAAPLEARYEREYRGHNRALNLDGKIVPAGLSAEEFARAPAVQRSLSLQLACFECDFALGMTRTEFGRELFRHTRQAQVDAAIARFDDPVTFQSGEWGEKAARTYWAPILALLFSMLGVFVHVFRLFVTIAAYYHRLSFHRIGAADSPLAREVLDNSARVTAAGLVLVVLFTFFSDNRITGDAGYVAQREEMWRERPVVGAIAAHWTVNAQGFVYPFTRKISPDWLRFDQDPMPRLPVIGRWFADPEYA